jgi:hypothetical protein
MSKLTRKFIVLTIVISIFCMFSMTTSSHMQIVGTEWGHSTGYRLDTTSHLGGTSFTYRIESSSHMTSAVETTIRNGANSWSAAVSISQASFNLGGLGTVRFVSLPSNVSVRAVKQTNSSTHHVSSFVLELNPNRTITRGIVAREFGRVIGLRYLGGNNNNDPGDTSLARNHNIGNVMWHDENVQVFATAPTTRDRAGARAITGQQCTHTTISTYYYPMKSETVSGHKRNVHRQACTHCFGWTNNSTNIRACTNYNNNGICVTCNTARNGNVTMSGRISTNDANEILKYVAGMDNVITSPTRFYLADVNGDGVVDFWDANEINKFLAGMPSILG